MTISSKAILSLTAVTALGLSSCATAPQSNPNVSNSNTTATQKQPQVRVIKPQSNVRYRGQQYGTTNNQAAAQGDRLGQLIQDSEGDYESNELRIEQRTRVRRLGDPPRATQNGVIFDNLDFNQWLSVSSYRADQVSQYQSYLAGYVGAYAVPPMDQLLTTARSWEKCGYEPYQLPPRELWSNMIMTLRLYGTLKSRGILPPTTEIRSVYRSPDLNACAGGAKSSKHMSNGAIDIWVPEYDGQPWYINPMQDRLCQFWRSEGESFNFGLGLYSTGSIHLDTQGYRMWGAGNASHSSNCRYL